MRSKNLFIRKWENVANTNLLKTVVEPEIIENFCSKHQLQIIKLTKNQMKDVFDDMEPDLIGYRDIDNTLFIGEITASGYMGQKGRDFHVGAVKKVFEAFCKFYLIHDDKDNIIIKLSKYMDKIKIDSIKCFFIVPKGSKFINALGYRKRLFEKGIMDLETIELSSETHELMLRVLMESKNEKKILQPSNLQIW